MYCQVIAESLSEEEIAGLKEMFKAMDTDNSGAITFDELKAGLRRYGSTLKESEIRDLMDAVRLPSSENFLSYGDRCEHSFALYPAYSLYNPIMR